MADPISSSNTRGPNPLQLKLGGSMGPVPQMVAQAEAALDALSAHFGPWLAEEIAHLLAARARVRAEGLSTAGEDLNLCAHEVKSMGTTLGFPLITHFADSLCALIENPDIRPDAPLYLVEAHIDAIAAAERSGVRDVEHPVGRALIDAFDERVRQVIPKDDSAN